MKTPKVNKNKSKTMLDQCWHQEKSYHNTDPPQQLHGDLGKLDTIQNQSTYRDTTLFWVNYNDLTATSLEIMASKGNHSQMALIQVSEI